MPSKSSHKSLADCLDSETNRCKCLITLSITNGKYDKRETIN
jgi:hypothetical protein